MPSQCEPESPCIDNCQLDPGTNLCLGCYRSMDEISGWPRFSAAQKRMVLDRLAGRRESHPLNPTL